MKVKLLNRDLIRNFGGIVVEMNENLANKYIKKGFATPVDKQLKNSFYIDKSIKSPVEDKMVWAAPEQKIFEKKEDIDLDLNPYPKPNDSLFEQFIQ